MTYSHNSVRNNFKMTTASATKSIRLKKGTAASSASTTTPPPVTTPSVTAHSNSIASSTNLNINNNNYHFHQQHQNGALSTSPTPYAESIGLCILSTPTNNRQRQPQQPQSAPPRSRQQRQSPPQQQYQAQGGGAFFFANNSRRSAGTAGIARSPGAAAVRQSPATILGGGFSLASGNAPFGTGSSRKQRKSPTTFGVGGKVSPQHPPPLIPTALTHFAGSKCFDAPAPTALPKPPQHWTLSKSEEKLASSAGPSLQSLLRGGGGGGFSMHSSNNHHQLVGHVIKSSKRNLLDDFDTQNLKLLLNVQS